MPRPAAPARPVTALSLLAGGALALAGCAGGGGGEASPSSSSSAAPATVTVTASPTQDAAASSSAAPSTTASTASSSSSISPSVAASASADASGSTPARAGSDLTGEQEARVEALEDVLLTPQTAPDGVFTDMETQVGGSGGEPISTSLNLTGVTPTGACADLIDEINTQQAPGLGGALAQYEVDPDAVTGLAGSQAGAFGMAAVTDDGTDLMAPFGKLADTCGTFGDPDGVEATFTKVPGVPNAVHIALGNSNAGMTMFTMTVGGVTDGDELIYLGMVGLDEEIAAETLRAQVKAFTSRER